MPPRRPRPPPALPDEVVEEVLLRVPPDDPASLARAALACRRWRRIVADPAFRRRRLALHGATPPMLGFVCDGTWDDDNGGDARRRHQFARFVPTSTCVPPRADQRGRWAFDGHHGRVLLNGRSSSYMDFAVWDPITDQLVEVPRLPRHLRRLGGRSEKATVLCAATATGGACDHLDCHRGPFTVVLVGTNNDIVEVDVHSDCIDGGDLDEADVHDILNCGIRRVPKDLFACVYSSESGEWSEPTYAEHPGDDVSSARSALVGNALYFMLRKYDRILKYDLGTRELSTVQLPYVRQGFTNVQIELTATEDGRLGLAGVQESNELCLWSRDEGNEVARNEDNEEDAWNIVDNGWTLRKVIDLKKQFPLVDSMTLNYCLVGFVEGVCVAFVAVGTGLFTIDMKSGLKRKVYEGHCISYVVPYINFCTPALGATSRVCTSGV